MGKTANFHGHPGGHQSCEFVREERSGPSLLLVVRRGRILAAGGDARTAGRLSRKAADERERWQAGGFR
jgi:hypothetical protein